MKRKLVSLILVAILLNICLISVFATEDESAFNTQIRAAYWQDDILYTFAHLSLDEPESQLASLFVNNQLYHQTKPQNLKVSETPVHYMLLVDTSTSMPNYRSNILTFAEKLMGEQTNIVISIARFDRVVSVVAERLTDWDAVKSTLSSLRYNGDGSDISGSVAEMVAYLGANQYPAGELTNLVVITDGEPWYSNNQEIELERETASNLAAQKTAEAYPEVLIHTYSFDVWNEDLYTALSGGNGLHFVGEPVAEAGKALAEFSNALYAISFPLGGYEEQSYIRSALMLNVSNQFVSYGDVRNTGIVPELDVDNTQLDNPEESSAPTEATDPEETMPTETTTPEETDPTDAVTPEDTTPSTDESGGETGDDGKTNEEDKNKQEEEKKFEDIPLFVWILCAAVAALCLILVVVVLAVKKQRIRATSVRIRIQVVLGNIRVKDIYYLTRELQIGSDKHCDVIVPQAYSSSASARIFKQGQLIYIEDMGASDGILLNGMRIFSSNRLRSGDEITIGTVVLKVLF